MKIVNNVLNKKMIALLREHIGTKLISFRYDYHFEDNQTANDAGIEFAFEGKNIILFSEIKYFDVLDGEDYSYIAVCDETDCEYDNFKSSTKKEEIFLNQTVRDIQVVTDTYHFSNADRQIDESYVCDYAIIFVLDNVKICFEKFDIFETDLEISRLPLSAEFEYFDNSADFENPDCYKTERRRTIKSLKD